MKGIIAAGGKGTRLRPLTFSSNKHLIPIANKPLLLYAVEALAQTGIRDVGVIVNQTRPAIEALLGNGKHWGLKFTYIEQREPKGLAHVVKISSRFLGQSPFVYHLGDNIFSHGISRPFQRFVAEKPDALLTYVKHPENYRLGVPYFDAAGRLIKVVEKPAQPPNPYGVPGLYFFTHKVFTAFSGKDQIKPSARGELEITDLYNYLLNKGYRVAAQEIEGVWLDPGKFNDVLDANKTMLDRLDQADIQGKIVNSPVQGITVIGAHSLIQNSKIIGPVNIAAAVTITNSTIGPHVSIASNTLVENCQLQSSIVLENARLQNITSPIVNSLIGKNTQVWTAREKTVSLFIGDHCLVRLT